MMDSRPVIAIVGGIRQETLKGFSPQEFETSIDNYRQACQELGAVLAREKMRLLVWSSDPRFVEIDVIKGYLSIQNVSPQSIICVWHKDYYPDFPMQDDENSPILLKRSHYDDWEVGFYESIKEEADGAILLGGGSTTLVAGVVAASWGKAIFSAPHFHGKAEMLYKWMHTESSVVATAPIIKSDIDLMSQPWSPKVCVDSLRRQLAQISRREVEQKQQEKRFSELKATVAGFRSSRRQTVVVVAMILTFIASMVGSISISSGVYDFICFFLVLLFGGALGSTLSLLGTQRGSTLPIEGAAVVGAGIGVIVGVVQISPNVPTLFANNTAMQVDIGLIFSSAVFALLGGLAFESTLQNLISRGKESGKESSTVAGDSNGQNNKETGCGGRS